MGYSDIGFIGCGNMCSAMLGAALAAGAISDKRVVLYDKNPQALSKFPDCRVAENVVELASACDIIFLCVKPQNIEELFGEISSCVSGKVIVSIVAGLSIDKIIDRLPGVSVVRCMPNTPMQVLYGTCAVSHSSDVPGEAYEVILKIFGCCSQVFEIDEELQNASIPVHGSSPAFVFRFAADICAGAEKLGFDSATALKMFCSTLVGSAKMLMESGMTPSELERMVTSPGGTTKAALDVFDANDFDRTVIDAVVACKNRADELGKL